MFPSLYFSFIQESDDAFSPTSILRRVFDSPVELNLNFKSLTNRGLKAAGAALPHQGLLFATPN